MNILDFFKEVFGTWGEMLIGSYYHAANTLFTPVFYMNGQTVSFMTVMFAGSVVFVVGVALAKLIL